MRARSKGDGTAVQSFWNWTTSNAAALQGLGGVAAIAAAVVAVFTLLRAGLDSASRTRPYVVVEYRVPEDGMMRLDLVIRNAGSTAARDVSLKFTPPLATEDSNKRLAKLAASRFDQPISVLGPSQELVSVLYVDLTDDAKSDIGETLTVDVSYASPWWRPKAYRDSFTLQRAVYTGHVFSTSSDSVRGRLKTINESLKKIADSQRAPVDAISAVVDAVDAAASRLALQKPGVHWLLQPAGKDRYKIFNTGDTLARGVRVSPNGTLAISGDGCRKSLDVSPGQALQVYVALTYDDVEPSCVVTWLEDGNEIEKSWESRI